MLRIIIHGDATVLSVGSSTTCRNEPILLKPKSSKLERNKSIELEIIVSLPLKSENLKGVCILTSEDFDST